MGVEQLGLPPPADRLETLPIGYPEYTLGEEAASWAHEWLIQPNGPRVGQPFRLTYDQYRFLLWWYAVDEVGSWIFRHAVRRLAKGSGKSPFAAALALIEFLAPVRLYDFDIDAPGGCIGRPVDMPWVQIVATAESQTANTMRMVRAFAPKKPERAWRTWQLLGVLTSSADPCRCSRRAPLSWRVAATRSSSWWVSSFQYETRRTVMTTSTTPVKNHSWPHVSPLAAIALVIAIASGYWAFGAFVNATDTPVTAHVSGASLSTQHVDEIINPFGVMSDLTPVVAGHQLAAGASPDPFGVMSDLTPVVAGHQLAAGASPDPFGVMSDLTPVVAGHQLAAGASPDPFEVMSDLTPVVAAYVSP